MIIPGWKAGMRFIELVKEAKPWLKGGDNMIDLRKLSDVQSVVDSLSGLPKEALFYIAGYAEGWRDKPKKKRRKSNGEKRPRP